jgi:cation diffusion facilitator CzcD-associated flavoprotein CzcO
MKRKDWVTFLSTSFYTYNPWEQRFCIDPQRRFFKAIRKGKASVVTDHIRLLTNGILLKSGEMPISSSQQLDLI